MKRFLLIALTLALLGGLGAQEIISFQLRHINKRFEIGFSIPAGSSASKYDLYIFGRENQSSEWFKCQTILGDFKNLPYSYSGTVFWDPFYDFRPEMEYQFKLYAVPTLYTKTDYSYEKTPQVGILHLRSDEGNYQYRLGPKAVLDTDLLALPVGEYEVSLLEGKKVIQTRTVNVLPFRFNEADLTPSYGNLRLSSMHSNSLYAVGEGAFGTQKDFRLLAGNYKVRIKIPQPDSSYPELISQTTLTVYRDRTTDYLFDVPFGTLNLSANMEDTHYRLLGRGYDKVRGMMLEPGSISVIASCKPPRIKKELSLEKTLHVQAGSMTEHRFYFDLDAEPVSPGNTSSDQRLGSLAIGASQPIKEIIIGAKKYRPDADILLPAGAYSVYATISDGRRYKPAIIHIEAGKRSVHNFGDKDIFRNSRYIDFPFSEISYVHFFNKANEFPDPENPSSITNPSSAEYDQCIGSQIHGVLGVESRTFQGSTYYYGKIGVFDRIYLLRDLRSKKWGYAYDFLALEGGAGVTVIKNLANLELNLRIAGTSQQPMYRYLSLDGVKYRSVQTLTEHKDGSNSQKLVRDYRSSIWNMSLQAMPKLEFKFSSKVRLSLMAGVSYAPHHKSRWVKNDELKAWLDDDTAPRPAYHTDIRFPQRNSYLEGLSPNLRIGVDFVGW